jgi:excisionase family DNA binding protein
MHHDPLPAVPVPSVPRLLEVHEVAYHMKCSQETVRRFIRDGKLPAIRLGTHWRIEQSDLKTFIESLRIEIARRERVIDEVFTKAATQAASLRTPRAS